MSEAEYQTSLTLFINGVCHSLAHPDPRMTLLEYLRSPGNASHLLLLSFPPFPFLSFAEAKHTAVALTGTKLSCGEGGCGACTVMLSSYQEGRITHRSINACLTPLCSLDVRSLSFFCFPFFFASCVFFFFVRGF